MLAFPEDDSGPISSRPPGNLSLSMFLCPTNISATPTFLSSRRNSATAVAKRDRWSALAEMNVARRDFACAEVKGLVNAVGGYGSHGETISSAEVYNPENNKWSFIKSLRRPRSGCFACGMEGKLYVMVGRSSFTIGNSKLIDIYNPEHKTWCENKNGCVMVIAHAVLSGRLLCMEWKDLRKLAVFNSTDNSWKMVPVPVTGSKALGFSLGLLMGSYFSFHQQCTET